MFDNLSSRLGTTFKNLRGQGRLSEANIKEALREVRMALLEADVALPVIKLFIQQVSEKAVGHDVIDSLTPGQAFIKVVKDELTSLMGDENEALKFNTEPPAVYLMAGLQGAGKTTSVAKLAYWLKQRHKKSVVVASTDVYRPAAIDQLQTLAEEVDVSFFPSTTNDLPEKIATDVITFARKKFIDVVIIDTAGRLHVDEQMMDEIINIHRVAQPIETLFVVDSMTGQDAANTSKAFNDALPLTGVILTKTDGDARGGAALSVKKITDKPIKFMGVGEQIDALEVFHPDRIASRILGMGDVLSLVEEAELKVDKKKAAGLAKKLGKGKGFDLEDFKSQLQQMHNMGGIGSILDKMPGMSKLPKGALNQVNDKMFNQQEAIINSMTRQERKFPAVIKASRKRRIANGSGTQVQDVNRLLKQFTQMQKMMKKMSKGGVKNMLRGMKGNMPF